MSAESMARYRARQRGENVPKRLPGPKPGYQQSPEHVTKRTRSGPEHHAWQGEAVSERGGRARALRRYRDIGPCSYCGSTRAERHHRDGNTANNDASNIDITCRRCHMEHDGRLEAFKSLARANQPRAVAARWR